MGRCDWAGVLGADVCFTEMAGTTGAGVRCAAGVFERSNDLSFSDFVVGLTSARSSDFSR